MKDKDKKLAVEILEDTFISSGSFLDVDYIDLYVDAMQAYHEAKMKEVTDEDIVDYSIRIVKSSILCYSPLVETGIIIGAKAFRDGEIKHIEK